MIGFQGRVTIAMIGLLSSVILSTAMAAPIGAKALDRQPEAVPGEFIVKLKPQMGIQSFSVNTLEVALGTYVKSTIPEMNIAVIKRPTFETTASVIQTLSQNPYVQYVEPNFIYRINKTPNDPLLGRLWGMSNLGAADSSGQVGTAGVDIGAEQAWDIETGNENVLIAVIDTGISYNSDELKENVWTNEAELNGKAGVDDDGNGVIDDIHGANFVEANSPTGDPLDDHGHGTHCSATIGARGDDGKGLVGVAWKAKIMGVKFLSASGSGSLEGALNGINYATKMGAKIMSNSWGGGGFSQALLEAIQNANEAKALFVAAAGNDSNNNDASPTYPASYDVPNVLAVAAIDNKGQLASFSSYGKNKVHVGAPGVNIVSLTTAGYESWSGTSMATPHVSGIAALLAAHFPDMTGIEMKERIIATAKPDTFLRKKVKSGGVANAYMALTNTIPEPDMNDPQYWSFSERSISSEHPYKDKTQKEFTVTVDGANEISVYFSKMRTENKYDFVSIYDSAGKLVQKLSGNNDDTFSEVIKGNSAKIVLTSDESVADYGFDITKVSYR
jgi:thermitase